MADQTGQCLCGAVRFSVENANAEHNACHCVMCQRWAGAPYFGTYVEKVVFHGEENISRFSSSAWAERGFCKICGSNLFYRLKESDRYSMAVGTFDDRSEFKLTGELFIDLKPAGYTFAGDHERLSEAETMARFAPS
jgi:hypothetical protein